MPKYTMNFDNATRRRRYPFRARTKADKVRATAACNEALRNVQDMIEGLAKRYMPPGTSPEDLEDVIQDCNEWLFKKSLPEYDRWHKPPVKVSTFLRSCIFNFVRQRRRAVLQKNRPGRPEIHENYPFHTMPDRDESLDRNIEAVAERIMANPEEFLTKQQAAALNAVVNNDAGATMQQLSENLGYRLPSSFSTMKKKVRQELMKIDIAAVSVDADS